MTWKMMAGSLPLLAIGLTLPSRGLSTTCPQFEGQYSHCHISSGPGVMSSLEEKMLNSFMSSYKIKIKQLGLDFHVLSSIKPLIGKEKILEDNTFTVGVPRITEVANFDKKLPKSILAINSECKEATIFEAIYWTNLNADNYPESYLEESKNLQYIHSTWSIGSSQQLIRQAWAGSNENSLRYLGKMECHYDGQK